MPNFGESLRRRMLIVYLAVLLSTYAMAVVWSFGLASTRGEWAAMVLSLVGVGLAAGNPLRGTRYVMALLCVCAAPVAALLYHDRPVAQVWSLIPLMFVAVFVRTWHGATAARTAALGISVAAGAGLLIAPADIPPLWLVLYPLCIYGAVEVFGVLHSTLLEAALRDPLTSVWNRAGVDWQVGQLMARAQRKDESVAVFAIDVDDFKSVNDHDGHAAGDRVLVHLAQRWSSLLPDSAVIGRIGGDEFVVVLPGCQNDRAQALVIELGEGHSVRVTTGMAVGRPTDARMFNALFAAADEDLYRGKRARKDAVGEA
ncbi:MAG: diguanylate cyclase [Mycobacterium sp.]